MGQVWSRRGVLAGLATATMIRPAAADRGLLAKLRQQGSIRIGIANNMPWSTLNPDGTLSGVAPAMVNAVVARLGIPKIEGIVVTYGELVPGLQAGRWDMIGASLRLSPERCKQVLFTDPFYRADESMYVAYIPSDVPNPPKSYLEAGARFDRIGLTTGTSELPNWQEAVAAGKKGQLVQFADPDLLVQGFLSKRVEIMSVDLKTMQLLMKQRSGFESAPIDSGHPNRGSGGAFRFDDTDLRDAFAAEFRALRKSGEVAAILKKYDFEYDAKFMEITGEQACAL